MIIAMDVQGWSIRQVLAGTLNPVPVDFPYDYTRDSLVDTTDVLLARNNRSNFLSALNLIDLSGEKRESAANLPAEAAWLWGRQQPN